MIPSRYIEVSVMIAASMVAVLVGSHIVTLSLPILFVALAAVFIIVWAISAGDYWWVPMLTGATILGMFRVGVKVSPVEVSFVLGIVGLAPLILVKGEKALQPGRKALPLIFYLTALFILVRLMVDVIPASGNRGNLGRILFDSLWPFIFGFLFHHYGSLRLIRVALLVMFTVLSLRCSAAIVGYLANVPLYIPGINYVLSFSASDSLTAMRAVALALLMNTLILFHISRDVLIRGFLLLFALAASVLVIMAGSRFSTLTMFFLPVAFFSWTRNWLPVILAGSVAIGLVGFVNLYPAFLDEIPPIAGRSLSGLVIGREESGIHEATRSSDDWHNALKVEGYHRWTQSPTTFLLGYGIRPSPDLYDVKSFSEDPKAVVGLAANTGSYECGFWTMLALFGAVGFGLYTLVFIALWRQTLPYLFARPQGTIWEGILFWGCYISMIWYVVCDFEGGAPSVELLIMILALDAVQDGHLARPPDGPPQAAAHVPARPQSRLPVPQT